MGKFFKLGDIAAFAGSLGLSTSLFYLAVFLPETAASTPAGWLHWTIGVVGLVTSGLALASGLASLEVRRDLYRPNLSKDSHKWLAVVELVGGGVLTVLSVTCLAGLPGASDLISIAVPGVPLGIFAVGFGIHLLQPESFDDAR